MEQNPTKTPLANKITLITGASAGLGKALALNLAKQGAKVMLISRNKQALQKVQEQIQAQGGFADIFACDVSDPNQVKQTVNAIYNKYRQIDILINNAAIWAEGALEEHTDETLEKLFKINTLGYIYFTKYVLPIMKKQKSGDMVFVNSIAATWEFPADFAPYAASKGALYYIAQSLRKEVAKYNIRLMSIYPPGMDTEIFKRAGNDYGIAPWMTKKENIADIIVYMLKAPKDINLSHVVVNKVGSN